MTRPTTSGTSAHNLPQPSPVQGPVRSETVDTDPVDSADADTDAIQCDLPARWRERLGSALWQLGYDPETIDHQLDAAAQAQLGEPELEAAFGALSREAALRHSGDAWAAGADMAKVPTRHTPRYPDATPPSQGPTPPGQMPPGKTPPGKTPPNQMPSGKTPPGKVPPGQMPPGQRPPGQMPPGPHPSPPQRPPDGTIPPSPPHHPGPTPPPDPGRGGHDRSLAPWLIGAGIIGAGAAGVVAFPNSARNVRALRATAAAFESGGMHQGGLQAINDSRLGARFTSGIGLGSYLAVATPAVNRIGGAGRLTEVARGELDHMELMAAGAAMRREVGDAVGVHEPTRQFVLDGLEQGRTLDSLLDELHRSAEGARPKFDNEQLRHYWDRTSILEQGPRPAGRDVTSGVSVQRPELRQERPGSGSTDSASERGSGYRIVETGGTSRIDALVAGRGARLDGRGLADGIGTIQGVNVSTLNPAMQAGAIKASGVDPRIVAEQGLNAGFVARWHERLTPPPSA